MSSIVIENVRGRWEVDKNTMGAFLEGSIGYGDGALIRLEVSKMESLCHHPKDPAACDYCKK